MIRFVLKIFLSSFSVVVASWLLPGVALQDFLSAILVALVLALLNTFLKPILVIFTIPVTIFTFGFFLLVINAVMALLAAHFVAGFYIAGFWWAMAFSIIVSLMNLMINLDDKNKR
ncbi:MAG TPA: phage holin family protein [Bacteroidales bacterium]|nr:phage holin family protein [Bacteroidales bacterium]